MSQERERERQRDRDSSRSSRNHDYLIKLRGISPSSTKDDIKKFLLPCRINTIHLFNNTDNTINECLVDLESEIDVQDALKKYNSSMNNRYIEVYRATNYEYNFYIKHKGTISWRDPVIHMYGLPFTCTMADVQNFFKDIHIARNGIYITRDMSDKALGGGYVAFINMESAYKAIDIYNQRNLQHRYIELTPSTYDEAKKTITNDAYLNGKRFAGESDDEDNKNDDDDNDNNINNNNNNNNIDNHKDNNTDTNDEDNNNDNNNNNNGSEKGSRTASRSRSERQSRSHSQDRRHRPEKRRHSPSNSPRSRSRPESKTINQRPRDNHRRRSRSRSPVRHSSPASSSSSNRNKDYLIKMRGMPFTVVEDDIRKFFPSSCQPVRIEVLKSRRTNRPNGDGHVYFKTMEAVDQAMKCDRKYMGNRYIELYFDSPRRSSSNRQRIRNKDSPRSSSKSNKNHDRSRSRSESRH